MKRNKNLTYAVAEFVGHDDDTDGRKHGSGKEAAILQRPGYHDKCRGHDGDDGEVPNLMEKNGFFLIHDAEILFQKSEYKP